MRIVIITEGGRDIGIGHLTRCLSLCQAFEETGIVPEFIVNGDDVAENLLHGKKHTIFNWLKDEEKAYESASGADVVIIDSYLADPDFYKNIARAAGKAVYLDDNKRLDYPAGIVVNGSVSAEELDYRRKEDVIYLLGSAYIPLRKDFRDVPPRNINDKIESVMITFGGDDSRNMTQPALELLSEKYPGMKKNVMIGSGFRAVKRIEGAADRNTSLIRSPGAAEMKKVMLESDIALSAAGQTLYECAGTGLPAVVVAIAENQLRNAQGWQRAGFIEYAGWWEDTQISKNIIDGIEALKNKNSREQKSLIGQRSVDGKGGLRVRDFLLKRVKNAVKQT